MRHLASSVRTALRRPLAIAAGALTLAPALASAGVGLALLWTVLLRPLPYPDAGALVVVEHNWRGFGATGISYSLREFYAQHARSLGGFGLAARAEVTVSPPQGRPRRLAAVQTNSAMFGLLRSRPAIGRLFTEEDDRIGAPPVAVLSHQLWHEDFGADPGIVGRALLVDGVPREVVGVTEAQFEFPAEIATTPSIFLPSGIPDAEPGLLNIWFNFSLARLAPGVAPASAERELMSLLERAVQEAPDGFTTRAVIEANEIRPLVTPMKEWITASIDDFVALLGVAVALVLALAIAATANVILARAEGRSGELGIRRTLGARMPQLLMHLSADPFLLCFVASAPGALVAAFAASAMVRSAGTAIVRTDPAVVGPLAAWVVVGIATLLTPFFLAVQVWGVGLGRVTATDARVTAGTSVRNALLGVQVLASTVLLVSGLALAESLRALSNRPLGFRATNVVTFRVELPEVRYPDRDRIEELHRRLSGALRSIPVVQAVSYGDGLPVGPFGWSGGGVSVEGVTYADAAPTHFRGSVTEDFFEVFDVPLRVGRAFTSDEVRGGASVAIVDESFARRYWGGAEQALGRRVNEREVVGVSADTDGEARGGDLASTFYVPYSLSTLQQWQVYSANYAVRTSGPETDVALALSEILLSIDPQVPAADVATLRGLIAATQVRERMALAWTGFSSLASIVVVCSSIVGLLLLALLRRRREIGVRKALGASDGELRWWLVQGALKPVGAGVLAGSLAVLVGLRVPESLLHGGANAVTPLIPTAASILLFVAGAGFWTSAAIVGVHPVEALRDG